MCTDSQFCNRHRAATPARGFTIARLIQQRSDAALLVEDGSLYPALHRLEARGSITSYWGTSENNRRAAVMGRGLASTLFGLTPSDPVTIAAAVGVPILVVFAAAYLPARRAAAIDPLTLLRRE